MRPTLALALMSALVGCVSPRGPHAEFRDGITPVAPPAPATGAYLLHSSGSRVAVECIDKGQPVGFARGADGAVIAVAGETTLPLQPGPHTWEYLAPDPGPTWFGRVRQGVAGVADRLAMPAFLLVLMGGSLLYAAAASNSGR